MTTFDGFSRIVCCIQTHESMKQTKSLFGILTLTAALATQVHAQSILPNGLEAY
jgi:hypothetical protein